MTNTRIEQLTDDYRRRLRTVKGMEARGIINQTRLRTKEGCFNTFIAELDRLRVSLDADSANGELTPQEWLRTMIISKGGRLEDGEVVGETTSGKAMALAEIERVAPLIDGYINFIRNNTDKTWHKK